MTPEEQAAAFDEALRLGVEKLEQGEAAGAQQQARIALKLRPGHAQAQHLMGMAFFAEGQYPLAYQIFDQLGKRHTDAAAVRVNAGLAALHGQQHEQALAHLQEAVGIEPRHRRAFGHLALLHLQAGDPELARAALLEAGLVEWSEEVSTATLSAELLEAVAVAVATLAPGVEGGRGPRDEEGFTELPLAAEPARRRRATGELPSAEVLEGLEQVEPPPPPSDAGALDELAAAPASSSAGSAPADEDWVDTAVALDFEAEPPPVMSTDASDSSAGEPEAVATAPAMVRALLTRPLDDADGPGGGPRRRMVSGEIVVDQAALRRARRLPGVVSGEIGAVPSHRTMPAATGDSGKVEVALESAPTSDAVGDEPRALTAAGPALGEADALERALGDAIDAIAGGPAAEPSEADAEAAPRKNAQVVARLVELTHAPVAPLASADMARHTLSQPLLPGLQAGEPIEVRQGRLYLRFGAWVRDSRPAGAVLRGDRILVLQGRLDALPAQRRRRGGLDEPFVVDGAPLLHLTGDGLAVAEAPTDEHIELFWLGAAQVLYVREDMLLAYSGALHWENGRVPGRAALAMLRLSGEGAVAIACRGVLCCPVRARAPLAVATKALVGWLGDVVVSSQAPGALLSCEGKGTVLVASGLGS